jgi:hypothetical protein
MRHAAVVSHDAKRRSRRAALGEDRLSGRDDPCRRAVNSIVRAITPPKHGSVTIALTDPARARLLALPRESEFVFTTLRRTHYRPSRRSHHWNRVRCSAPGRCRSLHRDPELLRVVRLERARTRRATSRSTSAPKTAANSCASCMRTQARDSHASASRSVQTGTVGARRARCGDGLRVPAR